MNFDREVTVTVCANTAEELQFWVQAFDDFFKATTHVAGYGVWEGIQEHNCQVSHLYSMRDNEIDWDAFDVLIKEYKCATEQFVVLVVYRDVRGFLII